MNYLLCDMFRDVIETAKEAGIWQVLTLGEKEDMVNYFLREYNSIIEETQYRAGHAAAGK